MKSNPDFDTFLWLAFFSAMAIWCIYILDIINAKSVYYFSLLEAEFVIAVWYSYCLQTHAGFKEMKYVYVIQLYCL